LGCAEAPLFFYAEELRPPTIQYKAIFRPNKECRINPSQPSQPSLTFYIDIIQQAKFMVIRIVL